MTWSAPDLVLRELCSLDRPLRESETLSVYDGEDLDYLMRQHTPWYRHVHLLGPFSGFSMYLAILHVGEKPKYQKTNTVRDIIIIWHYTCCTPTTVQVFGTASRSSDRNEGNTNESDEINNEGKEKSLPAT